MEQLILMLDEEVVCAGEKGSLTGGSAVQLLRKADALAVNFPAVSKAENIPQKLQQLRSVAERGSIFAVVSPKVSEIDSFGKWLSVLRGWNSAAMQFDCCAGVWVQDWMKLNKIWRLEK